MNKPPFNPNKPAFDPSQPYTAAPEPNDTPKPDMLTPDTPLVRGAKLVGGTVGKVLLTSPMDAFTKLPAKAIEAGVRNPRATLNAAPMGLGAAGSIVGGPGLGIAAAAAGKSIEKAGLAALGERDMPGNVVKDVGKEALIQGLFEVPGVALKAAKGPLGKYAGLKAAKALGFTKPLLKTPAMRKTAQEAGQMALDQGVMHPLSSAEGLREGVEAVREKAGQGIGAFLKEAKGGFYVEKAVDSLEGIRPVEKGGHWDDIHKTLNKAIKTVRGRGKNAVISYEDANRMKTLFNDLANWQRNPKATIVDKKIALTVRDALDESLEYASAFDKADFEKFLQNKKLYGESKAALDALDKRISGELGNNSLSLTDRVLAAEAYGQKGITGFAAVIAVLKAAGRYGNETAALTANQLAQNGHLTPAIAKALVSSVKKIGTPNETNP